MSVLKLAARFIASAARSEMELAALAVVFLTLGPACAEAIGDMNVCYILDGILVFFGAILTVLYCRLRMSEGKTAPSRSENGAGGIYEGLGPRKSDVYETIDVGKKPRA